MYGEGVPVPTQFDKVQLLLQLIVTVNHTGHMCLLAGHLSSFINNRVSLNPCISAWGTQRHHIGSHSSGQGDGNGAVAPFPCLFVLLQKSIHYWV